MNEHYVHRTNDASASQISHADRFYPSDQRYKVRRSSLSISLYLSHIHIFTFYILQSCSAFDSINAVTPVNQILTTPPTLGEPANPFLPAVPAVVLAPRVSYYPPYMWYRTFDYYGYGQGYYFATAA